MNKFKFILIQFFNLVLVFLIGQLFYKYNINENYIISNNYNNSKLLNSSILFYEDKTDIEPVKEKKEEVKQETKKEVKKEIPKKEESSVVEKKEEIKVEKPIENKEVVINKSNNIIDFYTGSLAAYGIDCYGCSGNSTSSGFSLKEGNIYYSDKTYGSLRVLAGDKSYPYGTVVKIRTLDSEILGIVLDRGSNIGFNKKFNFDLLFKTNKEALNFGSKKNVTFEILRLGY